AQGVGETPQGAGVETADLLRVPSICHDTRVEMQRFRCKDFFATGSLEQGRAAVPAGRRSTAGRRGPPPGRLPPRRSSDRTMNCRWLLWRDVSPVSQPTRPAPASSPAQPTPLGEETAMTASTFEYRDGDYLLPPPNPADRVEL